MKFIILVIIAVVIITVIKKRKKKEDVDHSAKSPDLGSAQQHTDFGFFDVLYKDTEERTAKFTELMDSHPELKATYNKIYEVFIPTKYAKDINKKYNELDLIVIIDSLEIDIVTVCKA